MRSFRKVCHIYSAYQYLILTPRYVGFRLHSVIPSLLERVVPPTRNYNLMGHVIPPGTVVATQAWSIHRDPRTFPSPERFDPERWLDDTEDSNLSASRAAHMMPFGLGTRVCVGQQLAQAVIRITLVALVRNFVIRPDSSTTESSMKMKAGFVRLWSRSCPPKGADCIDSRWASRLPGCAS